MILSMQTIDSSFIELYFNPAIMGKKRHIELEKYKEGDIFSLQGAECDDFKMPTKTFQVIKKVDEVYGIKLNGLVVKQIAGEESTIFSLTKNDCTMLGIDFQPKLQLFPMEMNWKEVQLKEREVYKSFNKEDFSTYPVDQHDNLIHRLVIKIYPVIENSVYDTYRVGNIGGVPTRCLYDSICICAKQNISSANSLIRRGECFVGVNITQHITGNKLCNIASRGEAFYEFTLYGISPKEIEGLKLSDVFDVIIIKNEKKSEKIRIDKDAVANNFVVKYSLL